MVQLRKAFAIAALLSLPGCGPSGGGAPPVSSSKEEITVKGTVTINGKPATGGQITFNSANINRMDATPRTAPIDSTGSYSITTLIGDNIVTVSGPEILKDPILQSNSKSLNLKPGETNVPIELP